jgi:DNA-binding transcriptional ArsR family regulator
MSKRSVTDSHLSEESVDVGSAADVLRALSNPNRLRIFLYLRDHASAGGLTPEDGVCVSDVCEEIGASPSTTSHHIRELELVGLVRTHKHGKHVMLGAACEPLADVMSFLSCETQG